MSDDFDMTGYIRYSQMEPILNSLSAFLLTLLPEGTPVSNVQASVSTTGKGLCIEVRSVKPDGKFNTFDYDGNPVVMRSFGGMRNVASFKLSFWVPGLFDTIVSHDLYVEADLRGKGMSSALMWAKYRLATTLYENDICSNAEDGMMLAYVREGNTTQLHALRKRGWKNIGGRLWFVDYCTMKEQLDVLNPRFDITLKS